jgi:hypothetical protein
MKEIYLELDEQFVPIVILLHPSGGAENPHSHLWFRRESPGG